MSLMEGVQHLKIPLEEIKLATKNFSDENFIARGGFGKVYIGKLMLSGKQTTVAVKRLDRTSGQGDREFLMEIQMLSCYKHKNLVSLIGFCDESKESILVYEHAKHGSLDRYLSDTKLSWMQRLKISLGAARGFNYLHNEVGPQHRVLHRDIKSSNILLNENWEAKISDFGLSKIGPSNVEFTFLVTSACGTFGYVDPQYVRTGILTKESDVYSFGVVLFEILCGRPALIDRYQDERRFLASLAQRSCDQDRLDEIILSSLTNEMKADSLRTFSMVAYQCLKENRSERPTMGWIVQNLEKALELQVCSKIARFIRVGIWGKQTGGRQNHWSFELEQDHKLQKITIDHGDVIYSLMLTTECRGVLHTSNKAGGWAGGDIVSEVMFDFDEEIVGINGTVGTKGGYTVISSLSFNTNKRTHGPFGRASNSVFSIPWEKEKGSIVGLYGLAGYYIDSIGVYLKAYDEIMRVGTWGTTEPGSPQNFWSFQLERNHHLKMITIDHGDLIYSLMFTTQYKGLTYTSEKAGGWNGGDTVSKVTFDWNEEIIAINGMVALSRGTYAGYTIISSISFVTNKKTHGPFGQERGTPFTLHWDNGSFAGFYGLAGYYIDSIGVYFKAYDEIMRVGTWGTTDPGSPQNFWSFQLERNHHLKMITIDHGDLIYSLMFTTQYKGLTYTSEKAGGWNGGDTVSKVTFDWNEEIIAINGMVALSRGTYAGYTIISSISFVTNKKTHGPFGQERGTPFTLQWDNGSFAGFYGVAGFYIDSIGVYFKAPTV